MSRSREAAVVARLRAAGCVFAEDEARLLLTEAGSPADLERMVGRRVAGVPLEHVLGWAEFGGLRIAVGPGVFVPRRRTELLVEEAVPLARPGAVVVDLFEALPAELHGRVDLLLANVPYVPSDAIALMPPEARLHEARVALDGGADGLDVARRVVADAQRWLAPGGSLLFETSEDQAAAAVDAVAAVGLRARVVTDDDRGATVVVGTL